MKYEQVREHINQKYQNGADKATFLVEVLANRRKLVSFETAEAIDSVLRMPICTGVRLWQVAEKRELYAS